MPPSISRRVYIKWTPLADSPPSPSTLSASPCEPTSTLVLSSAPHFVDVRIALGALAHPFCNVLRASDLDWAFAGQSSRSVVGGRVRAVFTHAVDSRARLADAPVQDAGFVAPAPDDPTHEIEVGAMWSPDHACLMAYEERWADVPVQGAGSRRCVVANARADACRATVVLLGVWLQGVLRRDGAEGTGDEVVVERWMYRGNGDGDRDEDGNGDGDGRGKGQEGGDVEMEDGYGLVARLGRRGALPGPALVGRAVPFSFDGLDWEITSHTEW